jgi:hypothetical protein
MICSVNDCNKEATVRFRPLGNIPLCEGHRKEIYEVREKAYRKHNIFQVENVQDNM